MSASQASRNLPRRPLEPIFGGGLTLAENDLRFLADSFPHTIWVSGLDGFTEYVNNWVVEYTGLPAEANCGWGWLALIHPDDADRARAAWEEASRTETFFESEYRIRRADGEFRWHSWRSVPVRGADGRIAKWLGTATDIEDRKVLEESLRRSEREVAQTLTLVETIQSAAPVGLAFVDREFRFVHVNNSFIVMNGMTAEQMIGRTVAEVVPELWPRIGPIYRRVLETGESALGREAMGATAAEPDRVRSWLASYYPVRVDDEIVGVGLVLVDLTERKQAEAFRSVVMQNMAEGLYTQDSQGRLTSMNRAATEMLGWAEEELLGKSMHDAVHFQTADGTPLPASECPMINARTEGRPVRIDDQIFTRKDGSMFPVSYSSAPLHLGSEVGGVVVVFHDITELRERQRREIETRHDQQLESLGRLSAGIAHEINTPIQFVGDNARFLVEAYQEILDLLTVYRECLDVAGGEIDWAERIERAAAAERAADIDYLTEEVPAALQQSLEGIDRVASLVRAMKSFSYKDSKGRSYADLNEALTTTLTVARNQVKYVADVVLDLDELPDVLCHVGDLNQVFLNLLVNAADAMQDRQERGERGEIRVSTRVDGPTVVIRIADNGSGIPEHLQQTVFEPFFTTKEVGKGTGQGLALARSVVDKHGGTIEVHSRPGEGAEFVLRLPIDGNRAGSA